MNSNSDSDVALVASPRSRAVIPFAVAALWQFVAWGGRISLLTEAERFDWWHWTRIGGSLVIGALLALVAIRKARGSFARSVAWVFLVFGVLTWSRSLWVNWTEPANSLAFNLMHTALAGVTWGLAAWCVSAVRTRAVSS